MFFSFIMLTVAVPFAESVTYTYDDANRLIQEVDDKERKEIKGTDLFINGLLT